VEVLKRTYYLSTARKKLDNFIFPQLGRRIMQAWKLAITLPENEELRKARGLAHAAMKTVLGQRHHGMPEDDETQPLVSLAKLDSCLIVLETLARIRPPGHSLPHQNALWAMLCTLKPCIGCAIPTEAEPDRLCKICTSFAC
jgi:hypothetical protein